MSIGTSEAVWRMEWNEIRFSMAGCHIGGWHSSQQSPWTHHGLTSDSPQDISSARRNGGSGIRLM